MITNATDRISRAYFSVQHIALFWFLVARMWWDCYVSIEEDLLFTNYNMCWANRKEFIIHNEKSFFSICILLLAHLTWDHIIGIWVTVQVDGKSDGTNTKNLFNE